MSVTAIEIKDQAIPFYNKEHQPNGWRYSLAGIIYPNFADAVLALTKGGLNYNEATKHLKALRDEAKKCPSCRYASSDTCQNPAGFEFRSKLFHPNYPICHGINWVFKGRPGQLVSRN